MAMDRGRFQDAIPPELYQKVLEASLEGLNLAVGVVARGCREGAFECRDPRMAACVFWAALNGALQLMEHPLRCELVGVDEAVLYEASISSGLRALKTASPEE